MRNSERGFSFLDLLASITIIGILAMLVVPQLLMAFDRGRQRRTMADMRNLSTALATYQLDNGGFPTGENGLQNLVPDHYAAIPLTGWHAPYVYVGIGGNGCAYTLTGTGSDQAFGPAPPDPWIGDAYEPDIILVNGTFLQAPGLPVRTSEQGSIISAACP